MAHTQQKLTQVTNPSSPPLGPEIANKRKQTEKQITYNGQDLRTEIGGCLVQTATNHVVPNKMCVRQSQLISNFLWFHGAIFKLLQH